MEGALAGACGDHGGHAGELVAARGGTITAGNRPGGGDVFRVALPRP